MSHHAYFREKKVPESPGKSWERGLRSRDQKVLGLEKGKSPGKMETVVVRLPTKVNFPKKALLTPNNMHATVHESLKAEG